MVISFNWLDEMIIRGLRYLFCDCDHDVKFHGNPEDILTTFNPGYYKDGVPVYGLCKDSSGMVSDKLFFIKSDTNYINLPSNVYSVQVNSKGEWGSDA